ncbi:MAG: hypothetical protein QM674_13605, partial [Burkholderiaceae bacterium]
MPTPLHVDELEDLWGLRSAGALLDLPSTGMSVLRWTRTDGRPFSFSFDNRVAPEFMMLSMVLRPMRACSWANDSVIWDGNISGSSTRLIDSRKSERLGFDSSSPFDLLHVHFSLADLRLAACRFGLSFDDLKWRGSTPYHN